MQCTAGDGPAGRAGLSESPNLRRPEGDDDPQSVRVMEGRRVLNLPAYIPYYLVAVNNAQSAVASADYLRRFGIGVTEWRVLSTLAALPPSPASRLCEIVALDKAAVSRALSRLDADGQVQARPGERDPRRRLWSLTDSGWDLHEQMLDAALAREAWLTEGITPADLDACRRALRQMLQNVRKPNHTE